MWRAVQPSVDREVAVKQIRAELASQPEFIRRFEAEAHLVARIEHPHIVPLIDYWRDPDSAYLVMRWLRGGSLEDTFKNGPWSPEATAQLLDQIAAALMLAEWGVPAVLCEKGRIAGQTEDFQRALELFDRAHRLAPDWPFPLYDAAYTHLLQGDAQAAEEGYRRVESERAAPIVEKLDAARGS